MLIFEEKVLCTHFFYEFSLIKHLIIIVFIFNQQLDQPDPQKAVYQAKS